MNIIWLGNLTTLTFHSTIEKEKNMYHFGQVDKGVILISQQLIWEAILLCQLVFSAHYLCNGVITVLNTKRFYCKEMLEYFSSVLISRRQFELSICLSVLENEDVKGFFLEFLSNPTGMKCSRFFRCNSQNFGRVSL